MTYRFDHLLGGHLKAAGALGALAGGAFQAGKGYLGMPGKGVAGALGTAAGLATPLLQNAHQTGMTAQTPLGKLGEFSPLHRAIAAGSYGAFMLPYLSKRVHDNKPLTTALNAAGLLGLGGSAAHSLAHGDRPAAYDLAGLGVMGAGMLHEHLHGVKPQGG